MVWPTLLRWGQTIWRKEVVMMGRQAERNYSLKTSWAFCWEEENLKQGLKIHPRYYGYVRGKPKKILDPVARSVLFIHYWYYKLWIRCFSLCWRHFVGFTLSLYCGLTEEDEEVGGIRCKWQRFGALCRQSERNYSSMRLAHNIQSGFLKIESGKVDMCWSSDCFTRTDVNFLRTFPPAKSLCASIYSNPVSFPKAGNEVLIILRVMQ